MTDTSGFYKWDEELLFGPNFVSGPGFDLDRNDPDSRDNTINGSATTGWYWFDTEEEAIAALVPVEPPADEEPPADPIEPDAP